MGKCVRIRGSGKPSPSPAGAAAWLTLRRGRRVPVASCTPPACRRHHRRGSSASCRRCGAKGACGGGPERRHKSAEPTRPPPRGRAVLGSQYKLGGARPEEEEEQVLLLPSQASTVARDGDGGCGDGSSEPNTPLAGDDVVKATKHEHGSTAGAGAAAHQRSPPSPLEAEMEAFFAAAELAERRRFAEAYNYDIALDLPLEGRFEWAPVR